MRKKGISRRSVVKGSLFAGAALGFPTIVPRSVFGANAPSNRINVGQIGCGVISRYHTRIMQRMDDVRVVAACDAYKSRRDTTADSFNKHYEGDVCKAHADFREVLARDDVDAVIVAAHDNWHTPMSIAAAKAGKDVYCQKPLSLDLTRTGILRKAINDNGRVFQFGAQFRSMGRWRLMVELVRNGYIGKLEHIDVWSRNVNNDQRFYKVKPYGSTEEVPVPDGFDFDAWQGPSPMVPYTVDRCTNWGGYHCPETSLGFLAGCATHPLGIAQWGNKADNTSPIRYEGTGTIPTEGIYRTLEHWDMMCEYENGVKLHLMDVEAARPVVEKYKKEGWRGGDGVVFHGSEGWIGNMNNSFYASDNTIWKRQFKSADERLFDGKEHNRNFIDCVKSRKETLCPVEMGIRCDTICHMTRAAAITGRTINWDPKTEQIVGDAEAAKMITRPYRKEWKVW